jgi:hypothetical protein
LPGWLKEQFFISFQSENYIPGASLGLRSFSTRREHLFACIVLVQARSIFRPEAEFLDEIQKKVFCVFCHCHLYSFGLRFLFIQTRATSYRPEVSFDLHNSGTAIF